jgi:hypothetical protein
MRLTSRGAAEPRLLHDFAPMTFTAIEAPY